MAEHKTLAAALPVAQAQMGKALKQSTNPHFRSKYSDLASVYDACMGALNDNGIAVIHRVEENDLSRKLITIFMHESGETLDDGGLPLLLGKNDMQGLGSALTYARRYGTMNLAGIAPEDDDGNAAAANAHKQLSWGRTVIAELPEGATDHEKATAIADALCAQFKRKRTEGELSNEWDRRAQEIGWLDKFDDLKSKVVDAYETRMMAITEKDTA